jgi:integrase/recombinase XerD
MAQVKMNPLTFEEVVRYFKAVDELNNEMYDSYINLLYCTGMRLSEVHSLFTRDISFRAREIHVYNTKRDKSRDVFFDDDTATKLNYYIKYNQKEINKREKAFDRALVKKKKELDAKTVDELLDILGKDHDYGVKKAELIRLLLRAHARKLTSPLWGVSYRELHHIVSMIGKRAGIQKSVHPHSWRYFFAQTLHDGGSNNGRPADLLELSSLLGHSSVLVTRGYLQPNKQLARASFDSVFNKKHTQG